MLSHKIRTTIIVALAVAVVMSSMLVIFSFNGNMGGSAINRSSSLAQGTQRVVKLTIFNNQPVATSSPFQQEIIVNSSAYSSFESANLSNIEFTYSNGTVVPSWLESGNSNMSTQTVYWLNVVQIQANSNLTIFMIFLPVGTVAFNGKNIGEASALSGKFGTSNYGKYNDMSHVLLPGLLYQVYSYPGNPISPAYYLSQLGETSMTSGSYVVGQTYLASATNPFSTGQFGTTLDIVGTFRSNAILDYGQGYAGNIGWPNPPVTTTYPNIMAKAVGWYNLTSGGSTTIFTETDDGSMVQVSSYGGPSTATSWLGSATNVINDWNYQGATTYSGTLQSNQPRIEISYMQGGGPNVWGVWTSIPVGYYHAALPPNGVEPAVRFSGISLMYKSSFVPNNIPSQIGWEVTIQQVGQTVQPSGGATLVTYLANGTYNYTVTSLNKTYFPEVRSGNFTVSGSPVSVPLTFLPYMHSVTFWLRASSELPANTMWFANATGAESASNHTTSNFTTLYLVNGTYSVLFSSTLSKLYRANGSAFTVSGLSYSSRNISIYFGKAYEITFNETGLGLNAGTLWYVNFSNDNSFSSTTNYTYAYNLNGTYSYTVSTVDKRYHAPGGTGVAVSGFTYSIPVKFRPVLYNMTFNIQNLPLGKGWYLNFTSGGYSLSGNGSSGYIYLMNGTYHYHAATSFKVFAGGLFSFSVQGSANLTNVVYSPYLYTVNFTETGLATGVSWYVNVSNVSYYYTPTTEYFSSDIGFLTDVNLTNGSYTFTLQSANKEFSPVSYVTNLTVAGRNLTVTAAFRTYTYLINVTAEGLPSGTPWSLDNSQYTFSTTGQVLTIAVPNGSYVFSIETTNTSFVAFPVTLGFHVYGFGYNLTVYFTEKVTSFTFSISGLPSSVSEWHLNISNGESILVKGQSVSFTLPYGNYSYTISIPGHGIVYFGFLNANSASENIQISYSQTLAPSHAGFLSAGSALHGAFPDGNVFTRELIQ